MNIEVDTGSRLDQSGDTTFAFSDDAQKVILLKQTIRDECLEKLKGRKLSKELRLFSACVYLLIRDHLNILEEIKIDREYAGHENEIKWIILNILKRHLPYPEKKIIIKFERVGGKGPAHLVAWRALRKKKNIDKVLTSREILSVLLK